MKAHWGFIAGMALLSAALLNLGDTLHPIWWAMWLAPIPMLVASFRCTGRRAALLIAAIALSGCVSVALGLTAVGLIPAILITVGRLLEWLGIGLGTRRLVLNSRHWLVPFAYPIIWAALDTILTRGLADGAAGSLAFTQMDALPVIQIAAVTGQAGIVFLIGLFASTVAVACHRGRDIERPALAYGLPVAVLIAALGYGALRLTGVDSGDTVPVGMAALDRSIKEYVTSGAPDAPIWTRYDAKVAGLAARGARIVVLPEKIARVDANAAGPLRARLGAIAKAHSVHLVVGLSIDAPDHGENRSWLFGPDGTLEGDYAKQHMVPHLEDEYRPGHEAVLRMIGGASYGLTICKDMDFPPLGRLYSQLGAMALLVPAWDFDADGWYHDRMAVLLGVESGTTIIRSALQGLMSVSDQYGRVLAEAPSSATDAGGSLFLAAALLGTGQPTLYARFGDWFGWTCLALWIGLMVRTRLPGRRVGGPPPGAVIKSLNPSQIERNINPYVLGL